MRIINHAGGAIGLAIDPARSARLLTFTIARISSSHAFPHSHDHLRPAMTPEVKKRQKMTLIISNSPELPQRSPHKFVNVMA